MKDVTIAGRYAHALFLTTEKRHETARVLEDLKGLRDLVRPGARLYGFLASPQVRPADKRRFLMKGLEGKASRVVAIFLDLLLRKKRLALFPFIVDDFEARLEQSQGIRRAEVVSAVPLTPAETKRLQAALEHHTRARIRLEAGVDPELLGGALVRIGDRVVDRSVRTLLESISRQLHEVSV